MIIYEKKTGKEVEIKYPVDAKEWLATGDYVAEKPKGKTATKEETK